MFLQEEKRRTSLAEKYEVAQKNVPEPCIPDAHADNSGEYIQQMDWESEEATAAKKRDFGTQTEKLKMYSWFVKWELKR